MSSRSERSRTEGADSSSISSTLLDRVRAKRPEAWTRLVELYGPVVYRWCRQSGVRREDAADLVQDVFAAVARGIGTFSRNRPGDSFRAWLATITRNKVRDHFRRLRKTPDAQGGTDAQERWLDLAEPSEATSLSGQPELGGLLSRRALELVRVEFENRTWDAFWRTAVEGRSPADVADELGVSVLSVYQAKSRVLRRLRRELGDLLD